MKPFLPTTSPGIEANELLQTYRQGNRDTFAIIRKYFAEPGKRNDLELPIQNFDLPEAQLLVARTYGFENWEKIITFAEEVNTENSPVWQFEKAIEAIISGDIQSLTSLLQKNPSLVHSQSQRIHQCTLLLYTGANGVEGYRQKSPSNAPAIAELLLKSGAEVDAVFAQGRGTTLGQVATSSNTVQRPLMEVLVKHGARIDGDPEGWQPLIAALDNARPEAAAWLAGQGATITIGAAAGIGRPDLVKKLFNSEWPPVGKRWNVPATREAHLIRALMYACKYGHTGIVSFLIENGVDIGAQDNDEYTGLHWAAHSGNMDTVDWLLQHQAPLEKKNCYGGTVLGQVIWSATNHSGGWGGNKPGYDYLPIIQKLIDAGAEVNYYWTTGIERIDNLLRRHTHRKPQQLHTIMPEFPCNDVPASVAWYRDTLGFTVNYQQHDIGVIDRDKARIILIARTEKHTGIGSCYVYINDANALYTELRAKGVAIEKEPFNQPWGLREFYVFDPDGNRIGFGQPFE